MLDVKLRVVDKRVLFFFSIVYKVASISENFGRMQTFACRYPPYFRRQVSCRQLSC